MSTAEFSPLPLFTQAQKINRKLKTVTLLDQDLARIVRKKLVEVGSESTTLSGGLSSAFLEVVDKIARQMLALTDEQAKRELAHLHNLIKEFEKLFVSAPPDWRRGVVFGILHSLTEPLVTVTFPPSVKTSQSHPPTVQTLSVQTLTSHPYFMNPELASTLPLQQ